MIPGRPACLVLGGGGFLGTNLCRRLVASGLRVRAFGRRALFPRALDGAEWLPGDFSDAAAVAAAVETTDVVFHLIHGTTPQSANLDMAADLQHNIVPSLTLLDLSRKLGVQRIVFVSSGGTVYGKAKDVPTPETAATDPITAYGISNLALEKYLALHEHLYGLSYRVLRVTNAFGPFQVALKNQGIIAAVISRALRNESVEIWGDGSVVRDFVFVDDIMDALEAAAADQSEARIFNIGSGQGRMLRDVIATIEKLMDRKLEIRWKDKRAVDVPVSVVSIERAKNVLGWTPKTPFEQGVQKTIAWWQSRGD